MTLLNKSIQGDIFIESYKVDDEMSQHVLLSLFG